MLHYKKCLVCVLMLVFSGMVYGHPGRTDAAGCHTESRTGQRHCGHSPGGGSEGSDSQTGSGGGGSGSQTGSGESGGSSSLTDEEILGILAVAALIGVVVWAVVDTSRNKTREPQGQFDTSRKQLKEPRIQFYADGYSVGFLWKVNLYD